MDVQQIMKFTYEGDDRDIGEILSDPNWVASLADYRPPIRIPKRSGGFREILEPRPYLKEAMRNICHCLADLKFGASMYAHGFVVNRSRRTNALPHVGRTYYLKMDLKDFFGSCTPTMVISALNYNNCPDWLIRIIRRVCFLNNGLPQGAPTSPMLANIAARELDFRLAALCRKYRRTRPDVIFRRSRRQPTPPRIDEIIYTRYADDLTFSSNWPMLTTLRHPVTAIANGCGFEINDKKTRCFIRPRRIEVCGVVISNKVNSRREKRRFWRGRLHRLLTDIRTGKVPAGHYIDEHGHVKPISPRMLRSIQGHVAAVVDISPQDRTRLLGDLNALRSLL